LATVSAADTSAAAGVAISSDNRRVFIDDLVGLGCIIASHPKPGILVDGPRVTVAKALEQALDSAVVWNVLATFSAVLHRPQRSTLLVSTLLPTNKFGVHPGVDRLGCISIACSLADEDFIP
jgi:hypothetical protein